MTSIALEKKPKYLCMGFKTKKSLRVQLKLRIIYVVKMKRVKVKITI